MKTPIEVSNRREGKLIKAGLDDAQMRAMVKIQGALAPLTDRGKLRVMRFVADYFNEMDRPEQ
jgi:hypothetical protein